MFSQFEKFLNKDIFKIISEIANAEQLEVYVIGGYVRDCLLKRITKDIDILVIGSGIEFAEKVADRIKCNQVTTYKNFGTAMLTYKNRIIEFVGARRESYQRNSRKPIVENGTLQDDQNRRDFTINAMAIGLSKHNYAQLLDPFNGLEDLKNKIIRTPLNPDITYSDDPLRMLRAIRFSTQLGFTIEKNSFEAIKKNSERIRIISVERITDEINKIMLAKTPSIGLKYMFETGLLAKIFPELHNLAGVLEIHGKAHKDNFLHTLQVLDKIAIKSDSLWLRWAALLHDIAKPTVKRYDENIGWTFHGHEFFGSKMVPSIFRKLKLPMNEKMKYVQKLVLLHLRPTALIDEGVTDSAIRRLLFDAGDDIDDLLLLCEADVTSKNSEKVKRHIENLKYVKQKMIEVEQKDAIRNFQPPISGEEIMRTYNLPPCKTVGIIKDAIKDAILDGIIGNNYNEALVFMQKKAEELGLTPNSEFV